VLIHSPSSDGCHSYFEIIKNPMDVSTMNAKLEAGMYKERFAFEADFRLMIRNAKTYNMPGTFAYNEALALESVFDKSMSDSCPEILLFSLF
jgi:transcription initiation factor TFIID subunit 2